jgi:hypothetical protein
MTEMTERTTTTRRSFLIGAGASLLAAPAIVRAASLMPVTPLGCVKIWCGESDLDWLIRCGASVTNDGMNMTIALPAGSYDLKAKTFTPEDAPRFPWESDEDSAQA